MRNFIKFLLIASIFILTFSGGQPTYGYQQTKYWDCFVDQKGIFHFTTNKAISNLDKDNYKVNDFWVEDDSNIKQIKYTFNIQLMLDGGEVVKGAILRHLSNDVCSFNNLDNLNSLPEPTKQAGYNDDGENNADNEIIISDVYVDTNSRSVVANANTDLTQTDARVRVYIDDTVELFNFTDLGCII